MYTIYHTTLLARELYAYVPYHCYGTCVHRCLHKGIHNRWPALTLLWRAAAGHRLLWRHHLGTTEP